jgi:signal transduction histidine kinase
VAVLLLGLVAAWPYLLIQLRRSMGSPGDFWNGLDLRCLILPIPISVAYVILRYRAYQRMHPTVLGVLILMASALVADIGAWLLRVTDPAGTFTLAWSPFLPLFAAALASAAFWSLQLSAQGPLARLFQGKERSYSAIRLFGQEVLEHLEPSSLATAIAGALVRKLDLERAGVWLWSDARESFTLAGHAGGWPQPPVARLGPPPSAGPSQPIRIPPVADGGARWLGPLSQSGAIEVVAPLWASGKTVGLLGLGKRWDEEIFDERDLEIVELVGQQAALFLLTALQVEELRQVPHQIAATQERERFKIAQELHDTIQQFLGRLPFYLEVSKTSARQRPGETEAILDRCLADVETAAQTVRQIRHNLAPLQLERSLVEPLRSLFEHFQARTGVRIEARLSAEVDGRLSVEARHALYRVVQQALDNVAAHAGAERVSVVLTPEEGRICFDVKDDGRGFSDRDRAPADEGRGFGLKSMAARLTSLGGEFGIESVPGAGTRVVGWLPTASAPARRDEDPKSSL